MFMTVRQCSFFFVAECSQPGGSGAKEFDDYLEIRDTVEKIRDLQKGQSSIT